MWYPKYRKQYCTSQEECSIGTLCCTQCPNFFTKSQNDLNYHNAKKHSAPKPDITFKCKFAFKSFKDFAFYVNIETLYTDCKSNQEQEMWMWNIQWEMLNITDLEKKCFPVNISWWLWNLKERDTKYSITQCKLSTKQS